MAGALDLAISRHAPKINLMKTDLLREAPDRLRDLGFRLESSWSSPGPSRLLVAIRDQPTRRHFDPEMVLFWTSGSEGRGHRAELDGGSKTPYRSGFSWGPIMLLDRFGVRNEFVTLGGEVSAERTDPGTTTIVFRSPGPILSLGGHSQRTDRIALEVGAFFGRMMVPIDFEPGMEQAICDATPIARYAAFIQYEMERFGRHRALREEHPDQATIVAGEARRLEAMEPAGWEAGRDLLERMRLEA